MRRRSGRTKKRKTAASVSPPNPNKRLIGLEEAEAVFVAVLDVLTVRVAVAGEVPDIDAD